MCDNELDLPAWVPAMQHMPSAGTALIVEESDHRSFNPEKHLRSFAALPWEPMYGDGGELLEGIRGKSGASEVGFDGLEIGGDLLELQPGSSFPLHVHPGDHILYAIAGVGTVTIDKVVHRFSAGSTFFIAAEYPHAVGTYADSAEPFLILAIGHPQKHVSDLDRMTIVKNENNVDQPGESEA